MNKALKTVLISNSLFVFGGNLIVPIYAVYVTNLGGGVVIAGALFGVKFLVMALVSFWVMHFNDGKNLDFRILKLNYIIRACVWFVLIFNASLGLLFVAEIILGATEGLGTPAFNAFVSEHLDKNVHMKEWATFELVKNLLVAGASFCGGLIVVKFGFPWLFLGMGFFGLVAFGVINLPFGALKNARRDS